MLSHNNSHIFLPTCVLMIQNQEISLENIFEKIYKPFFSMFAWLEQTVCLILDILLNIGIERKISSWLTGKRNYTINNFTSQDLWTFFLSFFYLHFQLSQPLPIVMFDLRENWKRTMMPLNRFLQIKW